MFSTVLKSVSVVAQKSGWTERPGPGKETSSSARPGRAAFLGFRGGSPWWGAGMVAVILRRGLSLRLRLYLLE